jgi:hypothetical protein
MKHPSSSLISVFLCLAGPGWSETTITTVSNPKNGPIWNICVTAADAHLTRLGMKGGESLSKESGDWAEKLDAVVKHAIVKAGAKVAGDLSADRLQQDEEMRQAVVRLRQKYESIAVQLLKKPGGVEKGRYTLGDEIALLPCAGQADVIAFVDGQGRSSTGGKKAFNVLVGGVPAMLMPQARNDIWIALADSGSGLVIAFVHGIASDGKTEADPESIFSQPLASGLQKAHVGWVRPPPPAK